MSKKQKNLNIWSYISKKKKFVLFAFFILLFAVLLGRLVTYLNTFLVDNAIIPQNFSILFGVGGSLVGLLVIEAILFFFQNKIFCDLGYEIAKDIRNDIFKKLMFAPYSYFESHDTAGILVRTSTYLNDVGDFVTKNLVPFLMNFLKFITVFIFMFALNFVLGSIILGCLALVVCVFFVINKISSYKSKQYKAIEIQREAKTIDSIFGLKAIVGGAGEEKMLDEYCQTQNSALKKWNKFSKYNELFLPLVEGLWFLGIVAVYVFAFFKMGSVGFELGAVISFIGYITQTNEPIKQTALNYQFFVNIKTTLLRIFDILAIEEQNLSKRTETLNDSDYELEIKDLCFQHAYKNGLQNFSVKIQAGEKVAFVGSSGAGKTTLACLIMRIYEPDSGQILLGGKDISKLKIGELEKYVSLCQDIPTLFDGTIRQNLTLGRDICDQDIKDTLEAVDLYDKIFSLEKGLEQNIHSSPLSQSDKQLFSLARLILLDPQIIVFDSAFNSMSVRQKKKIFKIIQIYFKEKTCIFMCDPNSDLPFEKCNKISLSRPSKKKGPSLKK